MRFSGFFFGFFWCFFSGFSQGIKDTVIVLKEVVKKEQLSMPTNTTTIINNVIREENDNKGITEWLKKNNSFFIKNYGQGTLASIAYRGSSAAQNEVYWNGIKINSPFTGQVDGNLLTIDPHQQLSLSSLTNTIGAQIGMDDNPSTQGVSGKFLMRYTSLNAMDLSGSVYYGKDNFFAQISASTLWAKNDFRVPDVFVRNGWKKQVHNALSMTNVKSVLRYRLKQNHWLSAAFWWSHNNREIPPLLTQKKSQQTQYDRAVRAYLKYGGEVKAFRISVHSSVINDEMLFRDDAIKLSSRSRSLVSRNEANVSYHFRKREIKTSVNVKYDFEQAKSDGYTASAHRHIAEINERFYMRCQNLFVQATIYQTIFRKQVIPTFDVWARYELHRASVFHTFKTSFARTMRLPSMNDLYWNISGNPDLKPEKGWKGEVNWETNHRFLQTKITAYGQYTTDWILWSPSSPVIWTPENLKRVYGCGTELFASSGKFQGKWQLYFVSSYNWNRTINMDAVSSYDASANKQLIYVPVHKAYGAVRGGWGGFSASVDYTYFSKIYTSTDNSQSLHGYGLMDVHLNKEFEVKQQKITIGFGIYNLLDTQYQTMPNRAMPGRYYEALVRFNLGD